MGALRYLGRFIRGFLAALLLVIVLLAAAIGYLGYTASGNQFLANRIAEQVSTPDMQVSLEGARGLLEGRFHLEHAVIADTKGKFAEIQDLDIYWTPSELLKWRFHADRIAAARVALDRLPVKTVETPPSDSSFSLPIEIKVDSFDLPGITLGKAVAERDTTLSLNGSAQAVSDRIALELSASEKDRLNATAKASLAYAVNARTLTLDSAISEPQGGLLARLLALPGQPPVEIAVKGDGPLDDWKGTIRSRVDGRDVVLLSGGHKTVGPGIHDITLNGGGEISQLLPQQFRALFAGQTKADIDARFSESGLLDIRAGSISNDSFTLVAKGQLDPKGEARLTAGIRPANDAIPLELPLASGALSARITGAELTLTGAFRSAEIDVNAALQHLGVPEASADDIKLTAHSASFDLANRTGKLTYSLGVEALAFRNPDIAKIAQGPVKLNGGLDIAPDTITLSQADIQSARLRGKISGNFLPATQAAAASFNLFLLPQGLLPPPIESKLSGTIGLSGQLTATLPAQISVSNIKLTSNLVTAEGSVSLVGETLKAGLAGNIPSLGAFADKTSGRAAFSLDASGPISKPDIVAHVESAELKSGDKSLQSVDLRLTSALDFKKPGGHLVASATYQGKPIKAEADAVLENGLIAVPSLKADLGANTISGALGLDAALLPSGKLTFDLPDIAGLATLAGQTADGALKGAIDLSSADGKITGKVIADGPRLSAANVEISQPRVSIDITDLLARQLGGKITADKIASGSNHLDQVSLDVGVAGQQVDFDLASLFDTAPLTAKGQIIQQSDGLALKLASFAAAPRKIPVTLAAPTEIRIDAGTAQLSGLTIKAGDGSITVGGTAGKSLNLKAEIADLPLSLANSFAEKVDASGTLSGTAIITGDASSPAIRFDAGVKNLATNQTRSAGLPALSLTASGQLAGKKLSIDVLRDASALGGNPRSPLLKAEVELGGGAINVPSFHIDFEKNSISGALALDPQFQPTGRISFDLPDIAGLAAFAGKQAEGAVKGTIGLTSQDGKIDAKIDATGAVRGQAITALVEATANRGALALPSLKIDIGSNTLSGAVVLDDRLMPSGKVAFDLPDIALLAAMAGQKAEGAIKGNADIASTGDRIDAKISATGTIRGQLIDIQTDIVSDKGAISLPSLAAKIGTNTVSGTLALDAKFMPSGKVSFDLPDLDLLAAMAGQKAEGSVKGTADIASSGQKIDAKVNATGTIRGQSIDVSTNVISDNGAISIPSIKADIGANTLSGALTLDQMFMPNGAFSFDFPDIGLLAAVAGQKADGALKGSAKIVSTDGKISGTISASGDTIRSNGLEVVNPVIDLAMTDLVTGQLSGHVTADRIASGANRLDKLALDIALAGNQTRFDLSSQFDAAPLTAKGALQKQDDGLKLSLLSFSAAPRKIPVSLARPADILISNGMANLPDLAITAGNGSIDVHGTAGKMLDLTAKISSLPLSLANVVAPGIDAAGTLTADVRITGDIDKPVITFETKLAGVATSQTRNAKLPALDVTAKGQLADNKLSLTADSKLGGQPAKVTAEVNLDGGRIAVPSFRADIGKAEITGTIALNETFEPAGKVAFDIPDANALASIVGRKAEGAIKGTADIKSVDGKLSITLDAGGTIRKQAIKALANIDVNKGAVSLPSLKLDVGKNVLSGAVNLDGNFLPSGKLTFDFPDVALLAAMAGQKAEGAVKGIADIASQNGEIDAKVTATGKIRGQAIDINVEALQENGKVSLPALKLDVGKNTVSGAFTLNESFMPSGKVSFDLPDIALLAALAGQKAEGAIKGTANITSENGKLSGAISAEGTKLIAAGTEIIKPVVDLKISDLVTGQISGKVTADRVANGANVVTKLALDVDRAGDKTAFDLKGQYDAAPLSAKGALKQGPNGMVVALDSFSASPKKIPVKLNKPAEFRLGDSTLALSNLAISAGKGAVTVTGSAGNPLNLNVKINALPASLANAFVPGLDAAGTISGNVVIKGDPTSPHITFDANWQGAAVSQTRSAGLSTFSVNAKGGVANNVLTINANARSGDGLSLTAGGTVGLAGGKALNIKVNGQLPFAALGGMLAPQGVDLRGTARFDIAVAGNATNPSISGRVTTSGATLTVIRQNLTIKNLAASVDLDGKQARIASLAGQLAGGGTLKVSGTVGITPNSGFPADLKILLENAVYTDGKLVAAKLSGDLGITGSLVRSPVLKGTIRLRRADITIPQKLPGTLAQIDIKHRNAPRDVLVQEKEIKQNRPGTTSGKDSGGMALDLRIIAPRQIFVRGRGLDAELGGTVNVAGSARMPVVTGGFKMLRGRLSIIGRRLDFTEGEISFGGNLTPALNMVASSSVAATTINVIVAGLANNPSVTFTSSPTLPQDEVMALLIFGRNSADLSPVQIAQLADAVSTLAGGQSNSLFNKLRQGLGVDDLDVGTDENGKSNVSVGKYLNKRTYLQLQQGVDNNNTSKAVINLDIGKGVKLRGEAGSDGATAGGVYFEKEY